MNLILFTLHDKSLNSSNNQCAGPGGGTSSDFNCNMQNIDPVLTNAVHLSSHKAMGYKMLTSFLRPEQWSQSLFS